MNDTRRVANQVTVTATSIAVALLLTSCGPSALPVHPEITWVDGREPSGPLEGDPRVQALREYQVQIGAARNSLNYSSPDLAAVATQGAISRSVPSVRTIEMQRLALFDGPAPFTVLSVDEVSPDEVEISVCLGGGSWWTLDEVDYESSTVLSTSEHGVYRHEHRTYTPARYTMLLQGERWKNSNGLVSAERECDPGPDVAVALYTTPPDLSLLTEATPDMVFGPDGEPIG